MDPRSKIPAASGVYVAAPLFVEAPSRNTGAKFTGASGCRAVTILGSRV